MESKNAEIIIGIDPDNKESGLATVYKSTATLVTGKYTFPKLMDYLRMTKEMQKNFLVVIEGGWLNQSNWHIKKATSYVRDPLARAAAIGRSTGMNAQTGILIGEMCESLNIPCKIVKPLKKNWSGKDGKITQDELQYIVGEQKKLPRMNQDMRDASLIAWVYAGLPIKVKPVTEGKEKTILQRTVESFDK